MLTYYYMNNAIEEFTTVNEYVKLFPAEVQNILQELRKLIKSISPEALEIISYKIPAYKLKGKPLIYFAAYKNHISMYPFPSGIEEFRKETASFTTSKGTIQFPIDKPIPFDLVRKIVEYRLQRIVGGK